MWLFVLSDQLLIIGLVGLYPTNYLISYKLLHRRSSFLRRAYTVLAEVSPCYPVPMGGFLYITHPSATNIFQYPFDLHVLSVPPAFVLSQDQTLMLKSFFC